MHRPRPAPAARAAAAALLLLLVQGATPTCIKRQRIIDLPSYAAQDASLEEGAVVLAAGADEVGAEGDSLEGLLLASDAAGAPDSHDEGHACGRDCDFRLADDARRRPVEVIRLGRPCVCKEPLPYHVEVPQAPKPIVKGEYGYHVQTLPEPTPIKLHNYEFDVERAPEQPPCRTREYGYDVFRPPAPPAVRLQNYAFDVQRPAHKAAPCVTRDLPYSVQTLPAPAPVKLEDAEFDVERPAARKRPDRLCGLTAAVDRMVVPAHDCPVCPPDVPCEHVICDRVRYDPHPDPATAPGPLRVERHAPAQAAAASGEEVAAGNEHRPTAQRGVTPRESIVDVVLGEHKRVHASSTQDAASEPQTVADSERESSNEDEVNDHKECDVESVNISRDETGVQEAQSKESEHVGTRVSRNVRSTESDGVETEIVDETHSINTEHVKVVNRKISSFAHTVSEIIEGGVSKTLKDEQGEAGEETRNERKGKQIQHDSEEEADNGNNAGTNRAVVGNDEKNKDVTPNVDEDTVGTVDKLGERGQKDAIEGQSQTKYQSRNSEVMTMLDNIKEGEAVTRIIEEAHEVEARLHEILKGKEGTFEVKEHNPASRSEVVEKVKFEGGEPPRSKTILELERLFDRDSVSAERYATAEEPPGPSPRKRSSEPPVPKEGDDSVGAENDAADSTLESYPAPAATEHGLEATYGASKDKSTDKGSYSHHKSTSKHDDTGANYNLIDGSDDDKKGETHVHSKVVTTKVYTASQPSKEVIVKVDDSSDSGTGYKIVEKSEHKEQDAIDDANTGNTQGEISTSGYESKTGSTYHESDTPGAYTVTETKKTYAPSEKGGYTVTKETMVRSSTGYGQNSPDKSTKYITDKGMTGKTAYVVKSKSGAGYGQSKIVSSGYDGNTVTSYVGPETSYKTDKGSYTVKKVIETKESSAYVPDTYPGYTPVPPKTTVYVPPSPGYVPVPPKEPGYVPNPPGYEPSTPGYLPEPPQESGYMPPPPGYEPLSPKGPGYVPSTPSYVPSTPGYPPHQHKEPLYLPRPPDYEPPAYLLLPTSPAYVPITPKEPGYVPSLPGYEPIPPSKPGYEPVSPGYVPIPPKEPGYIPSPPGYVPVSPKEPGYVPSLPGYQPVPPKEHGYIPTPGYLPDGKKSSYVVEKVTYGGDKSAQYGGSTSEYKPPNKQNSYGFELASGYNILGETGEGSRYEADLTNTYGGIGSYEGKADYHGIKEVPSYGKDPVPIKKIIKDYGKEHGKTTYGADYKKTGSSGTHVSGYHGVVGPKEKTGYVDLGSAYGYKQGPTHSSEYVYDAELLKATKGYVRRSGEIKIKDDHAGEEGTYNLQNLKGGDVHSTWYEAMPIKYGLGKEVGSGYEKTSQTGYKAGSDYGPSKKTGYVSGYGVETSGYKTSKKHPVKGYGPSYVSETSKQYIAGGGNTYIPVPNYTDKTYIPPTGPGYVPGYSDTIYSAGGYESYDKGNKKDIKTIKGYATEYGGSIIYGSEGSYGVIDNGYAKGTKHDSKKIKKGHSGYSKDISTSYSGYGVTPGGYVPNTKPNDGQVSGYHDLESYSSGGSTGGYEGSRYTVDKNIISKHKKGYATSYGGESATGYGEYGIVDSGYGTGVGYGVVDSGYGSSKKIIKKTETKYIKGGYESGYGSIGSDYNVIENGYGSGYKPGSYVSKSKKGYFGASSKSGSSYVVDGSGYAPNTGYQSSNNYIGGYSGDGSYVAGNSYIGDGYITGTSYTPGSIINSSAYTSYGPSDAPGYSSGTTYGTADTSYTSGTTTTGYADTGSGLEVSKKRPPSDYVPGEAGMDLVAESSTGYGHATQSYLPPNSNAVHTSGAATSTVVIESSPGLAKCGCTKHSSDVDLVDGHENVGPRYRRKGFVCLPLKRLLPVWQST